MEYIYGAMLLHKAGQEINEENLKKVLTSAGVKVDEARVKALVAALDGVNIEEALASAAPMAAAAPAAGAAPTGGDKPAEEKKEEKKTEAEAAAGLSSLFG